MMTPSSPAKPAAMGKLSHGELQHDPNPRLSFVTFSRRRRSMSNTTRDADKSEQWFFSLFLFCFV